MQKANTSLVLLIAGAWLDGKGFNTLGLSFALLATCVALYVIFVEN